jgi:deoxyribonuclease-4
MLVGAHISISGGIEKAPERGKKIGCETMQIFTKSHRQWRAKKLNKESAKKFIENLKKFKIREVIAHNSYLINLGSNKKAHLNRSRKAFIDEIQKCDILGIKYLVFHPGSHMGAGEDACIKTIAESLNFVIGKTRSCNVMLLLENTAGQGTNIGYRFEHLADIIKKVRNKKRVGVCFDTCHAFASGYDIRTKEAYRKTFSKFSRVIGLRKLKAFHLNDSKVGFNSRIDRHESIGRGKLGRKTFRLFMRDKRFKNRPGTIEKPDSSGDFSRGIKVLKSLRR